MTHSPPRPFKFSPRLVAASLLLLSLLGMAGVLRNEWVQDDTGIILHNALVQSLSGTWKSFGHAYWPSEELKELYRPLMISLFSLQWAVADGAPWVFRVVNLLAYGASILAVWGLLRRVAGEGPAWFGAAVFAVHPVHVEAVAVSVNQGETLVAAALCWSSCLYLDWREGRLARSRAIPLLLAAYVPALFIKEHALILPGLLGALELSILWRRDTVREKVRQVGPLYAGLVVLAAAFWMLRGRVIGGGPGTAAQEILVGLSPLGRAATMLGVVPEWVRLLLWPAHLQLEWSPLEYVPFSGWTLRESLGAIALLSTALALALSWGRRPRITLAILWLAVAIFPVSNLAMPTGVLIAERTLFLASVATALLATDLAAWVATWAPACRRSIRIALMSTAALLLVAGTVASAIRMVTWRNRLLFVSSMVHDAPLSFRSHLSWGVLLVEVGDTVQGDAEIRRAWDLHWSGIGPFIRFSRQLRRETLDCRSVVTINSLILARYPGRSDVRISLMACEAWLARYPEAMALARAGIERRSDADYLRKALATLDSARVAGAPAGTVRLPELEGTHEEVGGLIPQGLLPTP